MFKVERVADVREARRITHLRKPGNVAVKLAKPTRRQAKGEMIALRARADWQNSNSIVRVRT